MKTSDAFKLIVQVENLVNIDVFKWKGFNTWPIVRQILWFELTNGSLNNQLDTQKTILEVLAKITRLVSTIYYSLRRAQVRTNNTKIFISRPSYLQELHSGKYFDRIVDPIIESLDINEKITKYYVSKPPREKELMHESLAIHQSFSFNIPTLTIEQKKVTHQIGHLLGINELELQKRYKFFLGSFIRWYISAKRILSKQKKLKEIYLSSWYFPDMMGICAAASELGIKTIDVQHGKQGKYQAMYSGWTKITESGYALMPNNFWCWGQPSCDHILASSAGRKNHIPFIGGYPWIDYYKKKIIPTTSYAHNKMVNVLLTMQAPQGENKVRIPDFIIDFMSSRQMIDVHFTFRLHPNDILGRDYCEHKLKLISQDLYSLDFGNKNLYDVFMVSTAHITAYSSCCYEAAIFNVPTLLFGKESRDIYEDEISEGFFKWTDGNIHDLSTWISNLKDNNVSCSNYIKTTN